MTAAAPSEERIPFGRLVAIEARKAIDTRSGFWLALLIAGLTALILVLHAAGTFEPASNAEVFRRAFAPASALLPFVAILLVTAEFSARTALTTFVLVPNRRRVIAAKLTGIVLMSVVLAAAIGLLAALTGLIAPGHADAGGGQTSLADAAWRGVLGLVIAVVVGFGFGLLLRNTPAAIVTWLVVPGFVVGALLLTPGLEPAEPWIGQSSLDKLSQEGTIGGTEWAQIATAALIWLVLPVAAGLWRFSRAEIK